MTTNYARGRQFEYKTRDALKRHGYLLVCRGAGSRGIDLVAIGRNNNVLFVSCKKARYLPTTERAELFRLARECGATPVLACAGTNGRGLELWLLTRDGRIAFTP